MVRDVVRLAAVGVAAAVVAGGYATFRIWQQGERDEQRPADAIVVMGAAQYDGRPSPVFRARLEHAVALYANGVAPLLVVTGGKGTLAGPVVGGFIFGLLPEALRSFEIVPEVQWVIYGVLMVLVVHFLPEGIVPALRGWRLRRQAVPPAATQPQTAAGAAP